MKYRIREPAVGHYPITINVHEAKTHFSRILEKVHGGQEVILSKAGKPYARMVPLDVPAPTRMPGRLAGLAVSEAFFDPLPGNELTAWDGA